MNSFLHIWVFKNWYPKRQYYFDKRKNELWNKFHFESAWKRSTSGNNQCISCITVISLIAFTLKFFSLSFSFAKFQSIFRLDYKQSKKFGCENYFRVKVIWPNWIKFAKTISKNTVSTYRPSWLSCSLYWKIRSKTLPKIFLGPSEAYNFFWYCSINNVDYRGQTFRPII